MSDKEMYKMRKRMLKRVCSFLNEEIGFVEVNEDVCPGDQHQMCGYLLRKHTIKEERQCKV